MGGEQPGVSYDERLHPLEEHPELWRKNLKRDNDSEQSGVQNRGNS